MIALHAVTRGLGNEYWVVWGVPSDRQLLITHTDPRWSSHCMHND